MAKVSIQKQHDNPEYCDSETDADSDNENSRDRIDVSRHSGNKEVPCAYNDGYAIKACSNPPVCWSNYCFDHILSVSTVLCMRYLFLILIIRPSSA